MRKRGDVSVNGQREPGGRRNLGSAELQGKVRDFPKPDSHEPELRSLHACMQPCAVPPSTEWVETLGHGGSEGRRRRTREFQVRGRAMKR